MWEELIKERFPEIVKTKSGKDLVLKLLEPQDKEALIEYFKKEISDKEISLLRDNVKDEKVVESWCENINLDRVIPIVGLVDSKIVATGSLHRRDFGWSRFVGKIRVTVGLSYRNMGIGTKIIEKLIEIGRLLELDSLWAETFDVQKDAIKVLEKLGFKSEASLKKVAIDENNMPHDLYIFILRIK